MTRLFRDMRPILSLFLAERRRALITGLILASATVLAGIGLLGLSGWFITATAIAGLSSAAALTFNVFAPSAGIRFLALTRTASRYGERLVTHDATLSILAGLRERLFRGWAQPEAARNLVRRPAKLLFRLTADIDALDSLYLRVLVPGAVALGTAIAAGTLFGLMHPLAGLGTASFLMLTGFGIPILAARRALAPARLRAHALEALRSRTIDLVAGQTDLVMAGQLAAREQAICHADLRLAQADHALNRIETGVAFSFGTVAAALLAGTLLGIATLAERGIVTAPVAALGLLVAFAAVEPFAALRRGTMELGRTLLAARRITPRLDTAAAPGRPNDPPGGMAVLLENVSVRHEDCAHPALAGISFSLGRGDCLALTGTSGAGKSTLLSLIAGENRAALGVAASLPATLMTQRTELFKDTLRGNLLLADHQAGDARLMDALEAAGLRETVEALARGLDTPFGEGGMGLSGGQSRRLALARLFLRDTPLWLLDEPTEGLDGETARDVMERLKVRAAGRSVIIATHIRREAMIADRLLLIDHGRIAGTHRRGEPGFDAALARLRPD